MDVEMGAFLFRVLLLAATVLALIAGVAIDRKRADR